MRRPSWTGLHWDPVSVPYPSREVTEGAATLLVPDVPRRKGPGTVGPWPFYNPAMAVSRDLSALVLGAWPRAIRRTLDGLAATGAWGIRMGLEAGARGLVLNDWSETAAAGAEQNARRNGLDAHVTREDLRRLLPTADADFVDIDPFGTPAPFLDAAFQSARPGSGLGITATDTAVLCGTYPRACIRRYGARPSRCDQGAEIGLRILLSFCALVAVEHGKGIEPIVSFSWGHFLRAIVMVRPPKAKAPTGWVVREAPGRFESTSAADPHAIGPVWLGLLHHGDLLTRLRPKTWAQPETIRLLGMVQDEVGLPPWFVTTDELARSEHAPAPKVDRFLGGLRDIGYRATRTHFHPRGVKTDAPYGDVLRAFRAAALNGPKGGSRPAS